MASPQRCWFHVKKLAASAFWRADSTVARHSEKQFFPSNRDTFRTYRAFSLSPWCASWQMATAFAKKKRNKNGNEKPLTPGKWKQKEPRKARLKAGTPLLLILESGDKFDAGRCRAVSTVTRIIRGHLKQGAQVVGDIPNTGYGEAGIGIITKSISIQRAVGNSST